MTYIKSDEKIAQSVLAALAFPSMLLSPFPFGIRSVCALTTSLLVVLTLHQQGDEEHNGAQCACLLYGEWFGYQLKRYGGIPPAWSLLSAACRLNKHSMSV